MSFALEVVCDDCKTSMTLAMIGGSYAYYWPPKATKEQHEERIESMRLCFEKRHRLRVVPEDSGDISDDYTEVLLGGDE